MVREAPARNESRIRVCECGHINGADAYFCANCWRSLESALVVPDGEAHAVSRRVRMRRLVASSRRALMPVMVVAVVLIVGTLYMFGGFPLLPSPTSDISVSPEQWSMYGGNPAHNYVLREPSQDVRGQIVWELDLQEDVFMPPAVLNDRLVVGSEAGNIIAIDTARGTVLWRRSLNAAVRSPLVALGGAIFVTTAGGELHALNAENGELLWRTLLGGESTTAPAVTEAAIFTAAVGRGVIALDPQSGRELWVTDFNGWPRSSPLVHGGQVYVGGPDRRLYFLDALSGSVRTSLQLDGPVFSAPSIVEDTVYFVDGNGWVRAVSARPKLREWKGETRVRAFWSYIHFAQPLPLPPPPPATVDTRWARRLQVRSSPNVDAESVYVVTSRGLIALDRETGTTVWEIADSTLAAAEPTVGSDTVYAVTQDGSIIAIAKSEGRIRWRVQLSGPITLPAIVNHHGVHVVTNGGMVYQLN